MQVLYESDNKKRGDLNCFFSARKIQWKTMQV